MVCGRPGAEMREILGLKDYLDRRINLLSIYEALGFGKDGIRETVSRNLMVHGRKQGSTYHTIVEYYQVEAGLLIRVVS